jgi:hypothetical protein
MLSETYPIAAQVAEAMQTVYQELGIEYKTYVTEVGSGAEATFLSSTR